jgi:four helix bundle protein
MLSFQRLDVYQRAIEFLALAIEIVEALPRGHAQRGEQLINSAESTVRNIAEGAGRWSQLDSAKHYQIARGEAMESASSLDVFQVRKLVAPEHYQRGIQLLEGVVGMLTKMIAPSKVATPFRSPSRSAATSTSTPTSKSTSTPNHR